MADLGVSGSGPTAANTEDRLTEDALTKAPSPLPEQPAPLEELILAHLGHAHRLADRYWLPGCDSDDLHQEAAIALIEAAGAYRPAVGAFWPFAATVIRRRLFDRMQFEQRRPALNLSVRDDLVLDAIPAPVTVFDLVERRLELQRIRRGLRTLTRLEAETFASALAGEPYWETARGDNAVQRARKKLREAA